MTASPLLLHNLLEGRGAGVRQEAIVSGDRSFTYEQLNGDVERMAQRLIDSGAKRGDRAAILLPKSYEECVSIFAASRADLVFVPIHPSLRPAQICHIIEDCGASVLISSGDMLAPLADTLEGLSSLRAVIDAPAAAVGEARHPVAAARNIGEDLAAILYTSGSTGKPKGVMLSHRNLLAGTRIVRSYLGIGSDDRILSILPFSFDYGLNQLLTVVEQRAQLVLFDFKMGDEIVRALSHYRISGLAGVPMIWALLTRAAPSLSRTPLPHLRYITNSGGAVPTATVKQLRTLLPQTQIYLMYGLTEAFRSTYLPPEEIDKRPGSIGKAIPECEVYPLTDDGRRAAPGEPGILVHRGPTVSLGYWNRPEDTARVLRRDPLRPADVGGDIVCWSGDRVFEDEEGFLYFMARDDAMIKSSGYRISPTEVEEILMTTKLFRQVAVIGLPDEWIGQKVHVVAVAAMDPVDPAAALRAAAEILPAYMLPRAIELVGALPHTPNGKVDYKRLVAERS
jgi:acyl-CoA ligase (AMP-forming) (exosortase A-associated)